MQRPTFIATTGGRDLPVSGRFWVDESDGTVLRRPSCDAVDTGVEAQITVTSELDAGIGLLVPLRMEERYQAAARPVGGARRGHVFTVPPVPGQHQRGAGQMSRPRLETGGPGDRMIRSYEEELSS